MNNKLFKLIITAIFTALTFALTFAHVDLPTGAKVHLGNFAGALTALLFGAIPGGIAGGLGMMLCDIASGYDPSTFLRTLIVKFIFCFLVGYLFRIFIKRRKATRITLYITTVLFIILFIISIFIFSNAPLYENGNAIFKNVLNTDKKIKLSYLVPLFTGIFSLLLTIVSIISFKFNSINLAVITVSTLGVIINTILEFVLRILFKGILIKNFYSAYIESVTKLPANLITGVVTIIFTLGLFMPIYNALKNEKRFLDISELSIDENEK
jgi:uncharacterized membrane protein